MSTGVPEVNSSPSPHTTRSDHYLLIQIYNTDSVIGFQVISNSRRSSIVIVFGPSNKFSSKSMQSQQTANTWVQFPMAKPEAIHKNPTQGSPSTVKDIQQEDQKRMSACESNGIVLLEKLRRNLSIMHRIIEVENIALAKALKSEADCHQRPTKVCLIKSRIRQTCIDPKIGYFHPFLDEWRSFPSEEIEEEVLNNSCRFRIANIKAKYIKMTSGWKKRGVKELVISQPFVGSPMV